MSKFREWLLEGYLPSKHQTKAGKGHGDSSAHKHPTHPWWQVMCLTGVDYFSTLGYQPSIAFLAAGVVSPLATIVLVLLTLFGAYPFYRRVAQESPNGEGSIAMLEHLLPWWQGKLFVLALLGFAATGFIITITLSAADAAEHLVENPYVHPLVHGQEHSMQLVFTLLMVVLLAGVFLKGFKEAIGFAVALVALFLAVNAVVIGRGLYEVITHPNYITHWQQELLSGAWQQVIFGRSLSGSGIAMAVAGALFVFPKLALGLSGFETGVAVMPLVKGDPDDTAANPVGRIRNAQKLLLTAALIMSVYLICSSFVTTLLIEPHHFAEATKTTPKGEASGRALAFLAYQFFPKWFGTIYDLSTIATLWFAGASAMAGLMNLVPRYLPRYGMAPEWTRANRPMVLIFSLIAVLVTLIFKASVTAQGDAYATGVLALMTSAAVAVTISAKRAKQKAALVGFGIVAAIFIYTTAVNIFTKADGLKIASVFILAIVALSLVSRVYRTTELRVHSIELDDTATRFIRDAAALRFVANRPEETNLAEYDRAERESRSDHHIPEKDPIIFVEVYVRDSSSFADDRMIVRGVQVGKHKILRIDSVAIPNAIAAFLLHARDTTGKIPHAYFNWNEGNPILFLIGYLLSGTGDIAPVTREVLRRAEPVSERRPGIHAF